MSYCVCVIYVSFPCKIWVLKSSSAACEPISMLTLIVGQTLTSATGAVNATVPPPDSAAFSVHNFLNLSVSHLNDQQ